MESPSALAIPLACSADSLESKLQEILSEPVSRVKEREHTALDRLLVQHNNRCVLFGAGSMGRRSMSALRSHGVQPLGYCDNNPELWGTVVDDILVLSPDAAAKRFGQDALFFLTVRNEAHWYRESFEQLKRLSCAHISSADPITWRFPHEFLPFLLYDLPHRVYEQADRVLQAEEIWADEPSRAEYIAQVRLRALGDPSGLVQPMRESYILDGVFNVEPEDVLVDCGAFDGDTIRNWIARQPEFGKIEAVEADSHSFARLAAYVATLEPEQRGKIRLHKCAIGARRGTVRFEDTGRVDSKVSDLGAAVVDMVPLDVMFASKTLSIIKMDIEGAEFDALLGARQVIQRDRPILAICVYHRQDDLWRLPLLMRAMVPEYRMYLKTYSGDGLQTVAYAVPPERVLRA